MEKIYRDCIQCDSEYYIKESDQVFFAQKELELPKRCWACRQKNKREAEAAKAKQLENDRRTRLNGARRTGRSPANEIKTNTVTDRSRYKRDDE